MVCFSSQMWCSTPRCARQRPGSPSPTWCWLTTGASGKLRRKQPSSTLWVPGATWGHNGRTDTATLHAACPLRSTAQVPCPALHAMPAAATLLPTPSRPPVFRNLHSQQVSAMGPLADSIVNQVRKGQRLYVEGQLRPLLNPKPAEGQQQQDKPLSNNAACKVMANQVAIIQKSASPAGAAASSPRPGAGAAGAGQQQAK